MKRRAEAQAAECGQQTGGCRTVPSRQFAFYNDQAGKHRSRRISGEKSHGTTAHEDARAGCVLRSVSPSTECSPQDSYERATRVEAPCEPLGPASLQVAAQYHGVSARADISKA